MRLVRNTRGVALPLAIFALVVVGVLVAASFFVGRMEQAVGRNTVRLQQAFAAAEAGAQSYAANWDPYRMNSMRIDSVVSFSGNVAGGWYRGDVRRLNNLLFMVRSEGFSRDSTARQQTGLLLKLRPIEIDIRAGLETKGKVEVANATITGIDTNGQLGGCPVPTDTVAGIRIPDADSIVIQGQGAVLQGEQNVGTCSGGQACNGVIEDPTITATTLSQFGDLTWDDLEAMATLRLQGPLSSFRIQPVQNTTQCLIGPAYPGNWGEPWEASNPAFPSSSAPYAPLCKGYFPIIYVDGNLDLTNYRGQGVLLVNGNLRVAGQTKFYGPVVVRGSLVSEGGGNNVPQLYGGVIAMDYQTGYSNDSTRVAGNASILFSSCAVARALTNSARATLMRERSWANLY